MGRQRARTHGPSNPFSSSDFLLGPHAGRRNLVHLPERGGELPGRHRGQTRLCGGLRRRVLGGGRQRAERRSGAHKLPGGHGRSGSPPLPHQNSPLEAVVVQKGGGGGGRGRTTSFSDLARNHVHGGWVLVPGHEITVT